MSSIRRASLTKLNPAGGGKKDAGIIRLLEAFGPERLMWASDCPFQVQGEHTYEASVALIRDRLDFLSVAEREQILGGTAEAFFFLR